MKNLISSDSLREHLVNYCYEDGDNYLIEEDGRNNGSQKICAIYFTSAAVYYPNTIDAFYKRIVVKNAFEWYGVRVQEASRHIFIRDITKSWYQKGINGRIDTPDKLETFLRKETEGYEIVCLGASMGGFAALYFAVKLGAKKSITFSPYLDPCVDKQGDFANLMQLLGDRSDIVHYAHFSSDGEEDVAQLELARRYSNFNLLISKSNLHGIWFPREAVSRIINASDARLKEIFDGSVVTGPEDKVGRVETGFAAKHGRLAAIEYKLWKHLSKRLKKKGVVDL